VNCLQNAFGYGTRPRATVAQGSWPVAICVSVVQMKPVHMFELDDDIKVMMVQQLTEFSMEGCISWCVNGMPASLPMESKRPLLLSPEQSLNRFHLNNPHNYITDLVMILQPSLPSLTPTTQVVGNYTLINN
jgi:hypothetical protein